MKWLVDGREGWVSVGALVHSQNVDFTYKCTFGILDHKSVQAWMSKGIVKFNCKLLWEDGGNKGLEDLEVFERLA